MKHTVTKLEEENESVNFVLGNYLIELEETNNIVDTQPDLPQCSQADEIDCKLVDAVFVSRMVELDNG